MSKSTFAKWISKTNKKGYFKNVHYRGFENFSSVGYNMFLKAKSYGLRAKNKERRYKTNRNKKQKQQTKEKKQTNKNKQTNKKQTNKQTYNTQPPVTKEHTR